MARVDADYFSVADGVCMILLVVTTSGLHVRFFVEPFAEGSPKNLHCTRHHAYICSSVCCAHGLGKYWKVICFLLFLT